MDDAVCYKARLLVNVLEEAKDSRLQPERRGRRGGQTEAAPRGGNEVRAESRETVPPPLRPVSVWAECPPPLEAPRVLRRLFQADHSP